MTETDRRSPKDLCEWDPSGNHPAVVIERLSPFLSYYKGCHNRAVLSIGNGKWHLCESCAALPEFKRFMKRVPLNGVQS